MQNYYSLTHPQKRIWYIEKLYPDTPIYNIGGPIRIKGPVNFKLLEKSINILVKKNEGLRLRFTQRNGEAFQYVSEYNWHNLDVLDFSSYKNPEEELNKWIEKAAKTPFLIENERLFYFALFKIAEDDNGYFVKFHHIISDGWSINIMTEQICSTYMKLLRDEEIDDSSENSYIDYIEREREYLASERFLKNKNYWNNKYDKLPDTLLNKVSDTIEGKRKTSRLSEELSLKVKKFAEDNKVSLNTFFVSLFLIYLYKTTQVDDIIIGTPVLNRTGNKEKRVFGMFTSTMAPRFNIKKEDTLSETMSMVNDELIKCYYNQKYPYDLLVQDLELKKKGIDSLFGACVNYYNTNLNAELNGFPIENVEFYNGYQTYSLQLIIRDWSCSGALTMDIDYNIHDYSDTHIDDMFVRLTYLIEQIITRDMKIGQTCLLFEEEKNELLYKFNSTYSKYPKDKTICQLFEEQVARVPAKIAISFNDDELTYGELNEKANQLARVLINHGVKKESIVGMLTTHSTETIIGILAVLKAGGAYLPIDPDSPDNRINYMLNDSNCKILLTNFELSANIIFNNKIINLKNKNLFKGEKVDLKTPSQPNDLVYVIYTSGSTGSPKGVMIENKGLVNYICWAKKMYINDENDVFPLYSSLAFDLTVTSIFTPLISGCKIIVYRDKDNEYEHVLYRILKENKATIIKLTPSHLSLIKEVDNKNSSVKKFIVGGEDLKVSLAKAIHDSFEGNIAIFNEYGPTETVVGCMIHKYDHEKDLQSSVPIGIPADNVQIYILDEALSPILPNIAGELYISGDGVTRGYLNNPELTKEKLCTNPFMTNGTMYKSGDLARFNNEGKIEYLGRIDQQIKIRGYRIELGEIEKHLLRHELIKDAVVIDIDNNESKFLCAYIIKYGDVTASELQKYLSSFLPEYMIPIYFIELTSMPLTSNGKVDRRKLPVAELPEAMPTTCTTSKTDNKLFDVIAGVLNIERAAETDNFFHMGGDSIKAIQISSKMNEAGLKIRPRDILSHPKLKDMIFYVDNLETTDVCQKDCDGVIKPSPVVAWFFAQNFKHPNYYNQSVLLKLKKNIDIKKLRIVFNKLIEHHDSLRINYNSKTGDLFYNSKHLRKQFNVEKYNLSEYSLAEQYSQLIQIGTQMKSSFNIENDVLIKACVLNLGPQGKRLLLCAHHLVIDMISWRIIIDDICTMLKQISSMDKINLPLKTHSFQNWADALDLYEFNNLIEEKSYWQDILNHEFNIPADRIVGDGSIGKNQIIKREICSDETQKILSQANTAFNTEPKDILISALLLTIVSLWNMNEIVIEFEGHGRDDIFDNIDVSRTVGWFTNIYPLRFKVQSDDLSLLIKDVKEHFRKVPINGMGFGILKYLHKALNDKGQKYIRFNYLGNFNNDFENEFFSLSNEETGNESDLYNYISSLFDVNCFVLDGKMNIIISFQNNDFSIKTMDRFINVFEENLKTLITFCCNKKSVDFTPSDFDSVKLSQSDLDNLLS